jgi:LPS export ABC transporter protein LptC
MIRLVQRLVLGVMLLTLGVTGYFIVRTRAPRVDPGGPPPTSADMTIRQVQLNEVSGKVRWTLRADQASVYQEAGRTTLRNVHIRVEEPGRAWTVTGEEGDFEERSQRVEVRRNVVLIADDGLRLETSVLRWQGQERRLWTDAPVTIIRADSVVHGRALDVQMADEVAVVTGRVRATFGGERTP